MSATAEQLLELCSAEIDYQAIRAQGAGGQNVNKVASAIHLRFDIKHSRLPETIKLRLLSLKDQRINKEGVLVIKAQEYRQREQNIEAARGRLLELLQQVSTVQKKRIPTRPSRSARAARMDSKGKRAQVKATRGKVNW